MKNLRESKSELGGAGRESPGRAPEECPRALACLPCARPLLVRRVPPWLLCFSAALLIATMPLCVTEGHGQTPTNKAGSTEKRIAELEKAVSALQQEVDVYRIDALGDSLTLCDKKIPLTRDDVRERFEREFYQLLENKGLLTILVKRYFKYLGFIAGETQKMSLPGDLIYLVLMESYLNPRAVSSASAAGLWQFIKETGQKEGLCIDDCIDERYDVKKATRAGLTHLRKLHDEFGDWFIAMAAYNAGAQRLRQAIENQQTTDFLEMYLPEETERYIFRIIAMKEIIRNRDRYGIRVDENELYPPLIFSDVTIETTGEIQTATLSKSMDVPYRTFREYNLHLKKYKLPKGTYHINVPLERRETFLRKLQDSPSIKVLQQD
jgi:membrane-bound lytic murein transglycosylase D